jgi:XTP/dITP diphosphohydrolase
MTRLLLATRSADKAREIQEILGPLDIQVVGLGDLDPAPRPEEDRLEIFDTFRGNALAKAQWFARRFGRLAMADDSGLRVDALGGGPGVRTKRFSGRTDLSGVALDQANNQHLLARLQDVPEHDRGARYVCCAALAWPDGRGITALGSVAGRIATEPRGTGGFGYDPLFHVPELGAHLAEVPPARKNAISHRARAFRALAGLIRHTPWPLVPSS